MLTAYAELAAIAQAFGSKDAIKKLGKALGNRRASDGADLTELRRRMAPLIRQGLVRDKS